MPTDAEKDSGLQNLEDDYRSRQFPVREDMRLQRKTWRAERAGWCITFLIIILALLGLFSNGPLSKARLQNGSQLVLEFDRFERRDSNAALRLQVRAANNGTATIALNGDFLDNFTIETIQPVPVEARSSGKGIEWVFRTDREGWANVYLSVRPEGWGLIRSEVGMPGSAPVGFTQFIYP